MPSILLARTSISSYITHLSIFQVSKILLQRIASFCTLQRASNSRSSFTRFFSPLFKYVCHHYSKIICCIMTCYSNSSSFLLTNNLNWNVYTLSPTWTFFFVAVLLDSGCTVTLSTIGFLYYLLSRICPCTTTTRLGAIANLPLSPFTINWIV